MKTRDLQIILYYLNNMIRNTNSDDMDKKICSWFEDHSRELIGYNIEERWEQRSRYYKHGHEENELLQQSVKTIQNTFLQGKQGFLYKSPKTVALMSVFRLSPKLEPFIEILVHAANIPILDDLLHRDGRHDEEMYIMSVMGALNITRSEYKKMFSPNSELFTKGLFRIERRTRECSMSNKLNQILISYCETPKAICQMVLGKKMKGKLTAKHFAYMAKEYAWVRDIVQNSLKKKQVGINILVNGIPGTGKTEMVKAICHEIGVSLYSVSESTHPELESSSDRHSQLILSQALLSDDFQSVLMVDEAEDVFENNATSFGPFITIRHSAGTSRTKLAINRILENNPTPVIWITNDIRGIDPACLRRFSYVLNMDPPDEAGQKLIWKKAARRNKFPVSDQLIGEYIKKYDLPPAIIDTALKTARVMDNPEAIVKTIESLITVLPQRTRLNEQKDTSSFLLKLFNTDQNLVEMTRQIIASRKLDFSFCLYGVPGSGKSAYARYLADKLGMKVLQKRGSDIINPYVGVTEINIAKAFREAKAKRMVLVFDEADSFLLDRRYASKSWETTQVNEMLTQMESHSYPFFCTTNLMDKLDQAALRRFTFKIKYEYLSQEQVRTAFRHFFGMEFPRKITDLDCLTPGDFAVVAKKNEFAQVETAEKLAELLRLEQEVKEDGMNHSGKIGFLT